MRIQMIYSRWSKYLNSSFLIPNVLYTFIKPEENPLWARAQESHALLTEAARCPFLFFNCKSGLLCKLNKVELVNVCSESKSYFGSHSCVRFKSYLFYYVYTVKSKISKGPSYIPVLSIHKLPPLCILRSIK